MANSVCECGQRHGEAICESRIALASESHPERNHVYVFYCTRKKGHEGNCIACSPCECGLLSWVPRFSMREKSKS